MLELSRIPPSIWKLWKYLESLHRIGGWISPSLAYLARHFKRSISTIKRWLGELFKRKIISTQRRGPHPPVYRILIPTTDTCNRPASIYELRVSQSSSSSDQLGRMVERKPMSQETRARTQRIEEQEATACLVREYFGDTTIAGKKADGSLVARVSRILGNPQAFSVFRANVRKFLAGKRPDSWGIFITLAEQTEEQMRRLQPEERSYALDVAGYTQAEQVLMYADRKGLPTGTAKELFDAQDRYLQSRRTG